MGWVNVGDRLPENETPVLVAVYRFGIFKRICLSTYNAEFCKWYDWECQLRNEYFSSFNHLTGEVTYWQPLPDPPKSMKGL